jgi:chorismate mutase-like protein
MTTSPLNELIPFREQIDELDDSFVELIARRLAVCEEVAHFKRKNGIAMMQPDRVEAVKRRCAERGEVLGLRNDFVRELYDRIINEACLIETRIIER